MPADRIRWMQRAEEHRQLAPHRSGTSVGRTQLDVQDGKAAFGLREARLELRFCLRRRYGSIATEREAAHQERGRSWMHSTCCHVLFSRVGGLVRSVLSNGRTQPEGPFTSRLAFSGPVS